MKNKITIKDHYYSKEKFELEESREGVLKTLKIPKDLDRYYGDDNYISHNNNNKTIFEKIYNFIQNINFKYKLKILKKYTSDSKVLDYGCGNGAFLNFLNTKNYNCYGFEPNQKATSHLPKEIKLFENLEDINEKFEVIMLWHVLEHIANPDEIISKLKNLLSENGKIIIALPNYKSYDAKYYKEDWAAWDVPRHIYHYSKDGAIKYFLNKGLIIDKIYPLPFDAYYVSILSAKYKNSFLEKLIAPIIAQLSNLKALKSKNWSSLIYVIKKP